MEAFSWSEEDLKTKVLIPFIVGKGFNLSEMEFEKSFNVKAGTKSVTVRSDVLLKVKGQPMIVIEVKRPEHKINSADIDQAISYARLCESIAPFAIVTNLNETKLFDTYTRCELKTLPSLAGFPKRKITLNEELKFEALRTLFNLNYEFLQDFCQSQRSMQMMHLFGRGKSLSRFADELYINREGVQEDFEGFLDSKDKCFLLIGRQGTGKTFSMISLARSVGKRMPVLFYDAPYIPRRLPESIEEDFCWGSKQRTWYGDIVNQVDYIIKKHNTQMLIFIDSINEVTPRKSIKMDIIDLMRRLYKTSIRLCLACREEDWRFFYYDKGEPGIFSSLMFRSHLGRKTEFEGSGLEASTRIDDFSEHELDLAFPKYKETFDLKSGLSKQARTICRHPETLRMVSEISSHAEIPRNLRRKKILDTYWQRKLDCTGNPLLAEQLLIKIGKSILEQKNLEIRERKIIEMLPWNSAFQEVYRSAVSENILVSRRDHFGDSYARISPNLLLEYVLAKNLVEEYNMRSSENRDFVQFAKEISGRLKGFPLYEGSMLLFCSIMNNPSELVLHLMEQFELAKIVDQIIDETPVRLQNMLDDVTARKKICRALLFQEISIVRMVLRRLLKKYSNAKTLAVELILSNGRASKKRFGDFLRIIFSEADFGQIFDILRMEIRQNPKQLAVFFYKAHLANSEIARKILVKFKIGELRHIIKSARYRTEWGKSIFLISKINKRTAIRIDPSGELLAGFKRALKNKRVKLPNINAMFRKELAISKKKGALIDKVANLLKSNPQGCTWKEVADKTEIYKYSVLAFLEQLVETRCVLRERVGQHFVYIYNFTDDSSQRITKPLFAEYDSSIKEFTNVIIESEFEPERVNVDDLLEEMELGKYFSFFETCQALSFEILSSSIDIARSEGKNDMEIPGKTFSFWINKLKESNGMGKYVAVALTKNMSKTAPKMFKNHILGIRARQFHRESSDPRITSREQLQRKLDDFKRFFGPVGVRTPTEEEVFSECMSSLEKLADPDGRIRSKKAIAFFKNVKQIFDKPEILSEIEKRIELNQQEI